MPRGAFFDVDYTLLAGNSASLFLKFMRQRGEVSLKDIVVSLYYLLQYKLNLLDFEPLAEREIGKLAGQPESEMISLCEEWFNTMVVNYIYPDAARLIEKHRGQADIPVLLSAATSYIVAPLARHLNIDHYLCNRLEVAENKFTGQVVKPVCFGQGKIYWAEKLAAELGIDLKESFYYSDSITDLAVLERFGRPMVVNPDALLKKEATRRGWPIIRFTMQNRKNEDRGHDPVAGGQQKKG